MWYNTILVLTLIIWAFVSGWYLAKARYAKPKVRVSIIQDEPIRWW